MESDADSAASNSNPRTLMEYASSSSTPTPSSHFDLSPDPLHFPSRAPPPLVGLLPSNEFEMLPPCNTIVNKKGKRPRTVLGVWNHFTKIEGCDPAELKVACNYCGRHYACDTKKVGASIMKCHLNSCKEYPYNLDDPNQKNVSFKGRKDDEYADQVKAFNKEACRAACARMIIKDGLPFTFVEGEGFKEFCVELCPKFDPPSSKVIARDIYQLYLEEKKKLRSFFMNSNVMVSLTTDTWISIRNINYLVLTAHFVDGDWILQKKILNFCQIANDRGETIGKLIESCLIEWHIERVFTITMDNAKTNDVAIAYLRRKLKNWKNGCVLEGEFLHVQCCAHITNLIATEGLNEQNNLIDLIRKAVKYVRSSPSNVLEFMACAWKEKIESKKLLALDVSTRWDSTYLMLEAACKFERAFYRMEEEDEQYVSYFGDVTPQPLDWEKARVLVQLLKIFYDITLTFSSSLKVNSNLFFIEFAKIEKLLSDWMVDKDATLSGMASNMKVKLDKYWGSIDKINKLLFVAHVLDPRFKLSFIQFAIDKLYPQEESEKILQGVKDTLYRLFEFYVASSTPPNIQTLNGVQPANEVNSSCGHGEEKGIMWEFKRRKMDGSYQKQNEVDRYLIEPEEDEDNAFFNVLDWWKLNSTKYKVLSLLARDVLAIPLSTVASESAFNSGGRVLDPFRSSLTPKMVEVLICSQNWLRSIPLPFHICAYDDCFELCQDVEKGISGNGSSSPWTPMLTLH